MINVIEDGEAIFKNSQSAFYAKWTYKFLQYYLVLPVSHRYYKSLYLFWIFINCYAKNLH